MLQTIQRGGIKKKTTVQNVKTSTKSRRLTPDILRSFGFSSREQNTRQRFRRRWRLLGTSEWGWGVGGCFLRGQSEWRTRRQTGARSLWQRSLRVFISAGRVDVQTDTVASSDRKVPTASRHCERGGVIQTPAPRSASSPPCPCRRAP